MSKSVQLAEDLLELMLATTALIDYQEELAAAGVTKANITPEQESKLLKLILEIRESEWKGPNATGESA